MPLIPPELAPALGDGEWVVIADDEASPVRRTRAGHSEIELLKALKENKFPALFFNTYTTLRGKGYDMDTALCGAWFVLGPEKRPAGATTQAQFGAVLGMHRLRVLRNVRKLKPITRAMRLEWWGERLVHLDEATFNAALSEKGTASDRKLAYQVAAGAGADVRIEPTGEAQGNDYAELLTALAAQEN